MYHEEDCMSKESRLERLAVEVEQLLDIAEAWSSHVRARVNQGDVTNEATSKWFYGIETDVHKALDRIASQVRLYRAE